jgi:hypothetical protein
MLAVAIFAVAVLALAKSVEAVISAQVAKDEDEKVRRFLESKMMEVEAGAVPMADSTTEDVKGWLPDMKLRTTRVPVKKKNEQDQDITGLYLVTLEVSWQSDGGRLNRTLPFYIYPRQ